MIGNIKARQVVWGAVAYMVVTFPLAVLWHVVFLGETYRSLGYFHGDPIFTLGFLSILLQGIMLSAGYGYGFTDSNRPKALVYTSFMGLFFWTSQVLAASAKNQFSSIPVFAGLETIYLTLQFGLFGGILNWLYRTQKE